MSIVNYKKFFFLPVIEKNERKCEDTAPKPYLMRFKRENSVSKLYDIGVISYSNDTFLLEIEQFLLTFYAAWGGEAAEAAVGTDYSVAGDNEWDRIIGYRGGDGTDGRWFVGHLGKLSVRNCLTARDLPTSFQDRSSKWIDR